jgi:hypothetical protein
MDTIITTKEGKKFRVKALPRVDQLRISGEPPVPMERRWCPLCGHYIDTAIRAHGLPTYCGDCYLKDPNGCPAMVFQKPWRPP